MKDLVNLYRTEPFFWSRLGFGYDPPILGEDGNPIVFSKDFAKYRHFHDAFRDAGVKYHTTLLHSGWVGVDTYNYSLTDATLDGILANNPDIFYMPRVKLNVPPSWCAANPEETYVYSHGPREAEAIKALVNTEQQDFYGIDGSGYPVNGGKEPFIDPHTNKNEVISMQSFSSDKWRKDAAAALIKLMEHIDNGPYAKQIVGYHIAFGACGETTLWGTWATNNLLKVGDYGITARKKFKEYAVNKFGSVSKALEVLKFSSEDEIAPPSVYERIGQRDHVSDFFYHKDSSPLAALYYDFLSYETAYSIEYFCRTVKEYNQKYMAGAFYGYTTVHNCAHAGHLAIDQLTDSPYVDFLCSPKGYHHCSIGESGSEQAPAQSIARKKIWLDEIDNLTHLDIRNQGQMKDFEETRTILWREACKNLSRNGNYWRMDLGEGSFDSEEVMGEIQSIGKFAKQIRTKPYQSIAEVLYVKSDVSQRFHSRADSLHNALQIELPYRLMCMGTVVDLFRVSDLEEVDLSQYKFVVFGDSFYYEEGQLDRILAKISPQTTIVYNYAAGALQPDFSWENICKTSGFTVKEKVQSEGDYPEIYIEQDKDIEVLALYATGEIKTASKKDDNGRTVVLAAKCDLDTGMLRCLAKQAGVQLYAPSGVTVYADNRFVSFFSDAEHAVSFESKLYDGSKVHIAMEPKRMKVIPYAE